jgi:hypothetical protein
MDEVLGGLVEPMLARWGRAAVGVALVFWAAVATVFVTARPTGLTCGATATPAPWCDVAELDPVGPWLLLALGLGLVFGTAVACTALAPVVLAAARGEWPGAGVLLRPAAALHAWRRDRIATQLGELVGERVQSQKLIRLESARASYPGGSPLPSTAVSCVFAALRQRVHDHLGIDLTVAWTPFLVALPERNRAMLAEQSLAVLRRFEPIVPTAVAGLLAVWIAPRSVLTAAVWAAGCLVLAGSMYVRAVRGVRIFVDQAEATILVQRGALYRAMGLSAPGSSASETAQGKALTAHLWWMRRGHERPELEFAWPAATNAS